MECWNIEHNFKMSTYDMFILFLCPAGKASGTTYLTIWEIHCSLFTFFDVIWKLSCSLITNFRHCSAIKTSVPMSRV